MPMTMMRSRTRESPCARNHGEYPEDNRVFVARFAPRGRDPAVADENLYRYCGNGPMDGTDPSGLAEGLEIQADWDPLKQELGPNGYFRQDFTFSLKGEATSPLALVQKMTMTWSVTTDSDDTYSGKTSFYELVGFIRKGGSMPTIAGTWDNLSMLKIKSGVPGTWPLPAKGEKVEITRNANGGVNRTTYWTDSDGNRHSSSTPNLPAPSGITLPPDSNSKKKGVVDNWICKPKEGWITEGNVEIDCQLMVYEVTRKFLNWIPNDKTDDTGKPIKDFQDAKWDGPAGDFAHGTNAPEEKPILTMSRSRKWTWTLGGNSKLSP